MTAARTRLPNRRPNVTAMIEYRGQSYSITVGLDPTSGQLRELFCHGAIVGSDMDGLCDDCSILLSLLLQYGADPRALASSMGRLGDGRTPASIIGRLADLLAESAAPIDGATE